MNGSLWFFGDTTGQFFAVFQEHLGTVLCGFSVIPDNVSLRFFRNTYEWFFAVFGDT
jgi:hypothetical protein